MANKMWRSLLALEKTSVRADTKEGKLREEALQILREAAKKADIDLDIGFLSKSLPIWQGIKMLPHELLQPKTAREILWELYEINFRHEFLSVDAALHNSGMSTAEREELIAGHCWPNAYMIPDLGLARQGLNNRDLWMRKSFLEGMHMVMSDWTGIRPQSLRESFPVVTDDRDDLKILGKIEKDIAEFYVSSFFMLFHRAALVPHFIE
jgi:hypothetical protein